jgi:VanZ family protein
MLRPVSVLGKTAYYVGPMLLWMALIYSASSDAGSADNTRPVVQNLFHRLLPFLADRLSPDVVDRVDWNIRKTAHIVEYAVLAVLAFRAVAFGGTRFRARNVVLPFLIAVAYAASDEYHQSFSPSRGAAAADVTFDTFGVTIGLVLCLWHRLAAQERSGAPQAAGAAKDALRRTEGSRASSSASGTGAAG